jgi:hypothetical protein
MRTALTLTTAVLLLGTALLLSPAPAAAAAIGVTLQAYPAGIQAQAEVVWPLQTHHSLFVRAGYNFTDRQDFGEHDNEEGGGPGATLGYRYTFRESGDGWFVGARTDLWLLDIDWKDPGRAGSTDVVVLQPTFEAGYRKVLQGGWSISPFLALGAEINVRTRGEDVGEGAIFLGGVSLAKSF